MLINADGDTGLVEICTPMDGSPGPVRITSFVNLVTTERGPAVFEPSRARELALKLLLAAGHSEEQIIAVRHLLYASLPR